MYAGTAPDEDGQHLEWAKLGFVVVDIDGAMGHAVSVDENGGEYEIRARHPRGPD